MIGAFGTRRRSVGPVRHTLLPIPPRGPRLSRLIVAAAVLTVHGVVFAQGAPPSSTTAPATIKDERALKVLKGMTDALAQAKTLSFRARSLVPTAGPNGQWISLLGTSRVAMQRPDKLFVEMRGDVFPNDIYFDGKTWTAIAPNEKFYAQRPAAGQTVDAIIDDAYAKKDDLFPFADVLPSDAYARLTRDLSSALYVGQSTIGGVKVDHLAFTGKSLDWEIWIGAADRLPRFMLGAYRDLERNPTFWVEFADWKVNQPIHAKTFTPAIPAGATKIEFKRESAAQ
jgi:hypothetical protein